LIKNLFLLIFIFVFISGNLTANTINHPNLKAHEAIYNLKIGNVTNYSKIHNANGQMHLSINYVCDGWVINQNTTIDITDKNGSQSRNTFRYSTWESIDHTMFRFMSKVNINGEEVSAYEGESFITNDVAKIIYTYPYNKEIIIPIETLYPMKHFLISLDSKKLGIFSNYIVFSGEDDDSLNNVSTFTINSGKFTKVRSANFSYNDALIKPENEIEILVSPDTGVVHKVIFDYFDYQIVGDLKDIKYYNEPNC